MSQAFTDGFKFMSTKNKIFAQLKGKGTKYKKDFIKGMEHADDSDEDLQFWNNMDNRATLGFQHEFKEKE